MNGPRALFLMPPFSVHAGRRNWENLEAFYNPEGVFERVVLLSQGEPDPDVPRSLGTLTIVPLPGLQPRPRHVALGRRLYARIDPVARAVRASAREHEVELLVQRYGSPLWHGVPIVWAARELGLPSIITLQSDYDAALRLEHRGLGRLRRELADRAAWRAVLRHATAVWAVSEFVRRHAIAKGADPGQVVTIPNKDTIERFALAPTPDEIDAVFARTGAPDWADAEPLFLAVGRLIPQKNYPRVLEAFARTCARQPKGRLLVIGGGPDEAPMRERIRRLGVEDRVRLATDYLSARELRVLYHRASALVFCSVGEGQGRVVYEAMACGTPVIGSGTGPIPEMVEPGRTGLLVDPLSIEAIADALERVGRGELRDVADACRHTAQRFDLSVVNPMEAALYRDVLSGSSHPRSPLVG